MHYVYGVNFTRVLQLKSSFTPVWYLDEPLSACIATFQTCKCLVGENTSSWLCFHLRLCIFEYTQTGLSHISFRVSQKGRRIKEKKINQDSLYH